MQYFSFVTVSYSIILGLGIANLLTSVVAMFRSRGHGRLHWIPLAWAATVFIQQIQFCWAIIELIKVERWTFGQFLLLLLVTLLLFLAAALVIPDKELGKGEHLLDEFHRDGRWALMILSLYALTAGIADFIFWDLKIISTEMALLAAEVLLPLAAVMARRIRLEGAVTIMYLLLCLSTTIYFSPGTYQ